jgi:hypothetical protein
MHLLHVPQSTVVLRRTPLVPRALWRRMAAWTPVSRTMAWLATRLTRTVACPWALVRTDTLAMVRACAAGVWLARKWQFCAAVVACACACVTSAVRLEAAACFL